MGWRDLVGTLSALAMLGLAMPGTAGEMDHAHHSIIVENAWARRTPPMAPQEHGGHGGGTLNPNNSAVYVTIKHHSHEPDALVSATTSLATTVELHETIEQDGMRVMQPRSQFDIPKDGMLELKPGSYHIMLLGLKQALQPGETVPITLMFQKAGPISIEVPVK